MNTVYRIKTRLCFLPWDWLLAIRKDFPGGAQIVGILAGLQLRQIVNQFHDPPYAVIGERASPRHRPDAYVTLCRLIDP